MSPSWVPSFVGVLVMAAIHLLASRLHGSRRELTALMAAAGGVSVAYVFEDLLPDLAHMQKEWLAARPDRTLDWLDSQEYVVTLVGVILSLALDRAAARRHHNEQFWLEAGSFAIYCALIGAFATRLRGTVPTVLAVVAFGAHFLINDHSMHLRFPRDYARVGRWLLAGATLLGWIVAIVWAPPLVAFAVALGLVSGNIMINIIKEELPERSARGFGAWVAGALGYAAVLLAFEYSMNH